MLPQDRVSNLPTVIEESAQFVRDPASMPGQPLRLQGPFKLGLRGRGHSSNRAKAVHERGEEPDFSTADSISTRRRQGRTPA